MDVSVSESGAGCRKQYLKIAVRSVRKLAPLLRTIALVIAADAYARLPMNARVIVLILLIGLPTLVSAQAVDCSDAYSGKPAQCVRVACDAKYQIFLGTWKGPFHAYVRELSKDGKTVFRPYESTTAYAAADCLKNPDAGETFIVGHMTDIYPEFSGLAGHTEHSLLITGTSSDGSAFLRIVDEKKRLSTYQMEYQNKAASLAVWTLLIPGHDSSPDMLYSTIDGRDLTAEGIDRRNVTITLRVGPKGQAYFDGIIGYGFHVRQP
jgi:hypothetical protein